MNKVNSNRLAEDMRNSPKGRFSCANRQISVALGRVPLSTDLNQRHPFDVTIARIPPGKTNFPYHSHSAQWEFYHVISGQGQVRHQSGVTEVVAGDAFLFKPGEPHQLVNKGGEDFVYYVISDNPIGESCHYPDSGKWAVRSPETRLIRSDSLDYYDGEE